MRFERQVNRVMSHAVLITAAVVYLAWGTGYQWLVSRAAFGRHDYFSLLARAFLRGNTYLDVPAPTLDMSPYSGRVYLYWGPGNAAAQFLMELARVRLPMPYYTIGYCLGGLLLFAVALGSVRRLWFPGAPRWCETAILVALAFGSPLTAIGSRSASFHNESIALSFLTQCAVFLLLIILLETRRLRYAWLLGLVLALAVSVRITNVLLVFAIGVAIVGVMNRRAAIHVLLPVVSLLAATSVLIGVYNYARFGNALETGARYHEHPNPRQRDALFGTGALLSPYWIPHNSWLYFARLPRMDTFPPRVSGIEEVPAPRSHPKMVLEPPYYSDVYSLPFMMPVLLLLFTNVLAWRHRGLSFAAAMILASAVFMVFYLCYAYNAWRFLADVVPAALLAVYFGLCATIAKTPRAGRCLAWLVSVLGAWGVLMNWQWGEWGATRTLSTLVAAEVAEQPLLPWGRILLAIVAGAWALEVRVAQRNAVGD